MPACAVLRSLPKKVTSMRRCRTDGACRGTASPIAAFLADESGAEVVEWAVLTVIVVLASFAVLAALRDRVGTMFSRIFGRLFGY